MNRRGKSSLPPLSLGIVRRSASHFTALLAKNLTDNTPEPRQRQALAKITALALLDNSGYRLNFSRNSDCRFHRYECSKLSMKR